MRTLHAGTVIMLGLACAAIFAACEHDVATEEPGEGPTFQTVSQRVFSDCRGCHLGGANSGGLSLERHENIVNIRSSQKPVFFLVSPNNPDSSYILMKVRGDSRIDGSRMPPGAALSDSQIDHLESWIEAGAPKAAAARSALSAYPGSSPSAAQ